jgi:tetrapyrrole methylase family protein / MazG family protein
MKSIQKLIEIVKKLRAPGGCIWDRKQTLQSLTPHIIEEAYELVHAIKTNNYDHIKEELGDVLLHVVMLSNIAEDKKAFNIEDVAEDVSEKMIRRHPHVFGDTKVKTVDDVLSNWDKIKTKEKAKENQYSLDSVPKHFPALLQAEKIQRVASKIGFDWPDIKGPIKKVFEEIKEIKAEYKKKETNDKHNLKEEFGDLLFSIVNISRKLDINPEEALALSNQKFIKRFTYMEKKAEKTKTPLSTMDLNELDNLWNKAKKEPDSQ